MNARTTLDRSSSYRAFYAINMQIGLIISLLIFIGLFKVPLNTEEKIEIVQVTQETIKMEEIIQTKQIERPPPPPRPIVPVAVPNDEVIADEEITFDAELDLEADLDLPMEPPAPPAKEKEVEEEVFIIVERMPEIVGGIAAVHKKVVYPEIAKKAGIEGRVVVQFVINEQGRVESPRVIRGIGGGCDEEALRVLNEIEFTPGMQRGKPVKVRFTLPIVFQLQSANS